MADTQRSVSTILGLLATNTTGDISAQDMRDALVTWRQCHGQLYVPAAARAAVTISDTTNFFEATTPAWTLSTGAHLFDESAGNGRLTYTGTAAVDVHVALSVSFTSVGSNQVVRLRIGKNATPDPASEAHRKIGAGTDVGSTAIHLITSMSTGDYVSLWVRNVDNASDVTIEVANIQVVSMPK